MESNLAWEEILPTHLKKLAYKAGAEYAWKRQEAIEVLTFLSNKGYVVLGVDIWLATRPGPTIPTPFVYDWDLETKSNRAKQSAAKFVRDFEWDSADRYQGEEPYFNITAVRRDS